MLSVVIRFIVYLVNRVETEIPVENKELIKEISKLEIPYKGEIVLWEDTLSEQEDEGNLYIGIKFNNSDKKAIISLMENNGYNSYKLLSEDGECDIGEIDIIKMFIYDKWNIDDDKVDRLYVMYSGGRIIEGIDSVTLTHQRYATIMESESDCFIVYFSY